MELELRRAWQPGEMIVRRERWRGETYSGYAAIVVEDQPYQLALYLPEGAPFGFPEGSWPGDHLWAGRTAWEGHGLSMLHRPGDASAIFVFWEGPDRAFSRWYLNLQAPYRRTAIGIDTLDHVLDLWSTDGTEWHRKDEELLDERVQEGFLSPAEAGLIRAEADRFEQEIAESGPWWDPAWKHWEPDPSWPAPELPEGWASAR